MESVTYYCDWLKLPEDVWVEILCRIPADFDLFRLKLVCKSWNDLISNACVRRRYAVAPVSGFIYRFLKHKCRSGMSYLRYELPYYCEGFPTPISRTSKLLLPFEPTEKDILGCCNGLLLVVQAINRQLYLCNPATFQFVTIPTCFEVQDRHFVSLAFDPCRSLNFKVVCFKRVLPLTCHIFSSDTWSWNVHKFPTNFTYTEHCWMKHSVYLNDVIYHLSESMHLICIDIEQLKACAIDLPNIVGSNPNGFTGVSRGRLYYSNHDGSNLFVWVLEGYFETGRWMLMHNICLRDLARSSVTTTALGNCELQVFMPYALHSTSDTIFVGTRNIILAYDPSKGKSKRVCKLEKDYGFRFGQYTVWPYRRCLVNLENFGRKHCEAIHV